MVDRRKLESVAGIIRDRITLETVEDYWTSTGISERDFVPIPAADHKGHIFAVDGSNAVIFDWSVARANHIRAGYVVYCGADWKKSVITYDDIFLADRKSYREIFLRYLNGIFRVEDFHLDETELDRLSTYFRELQEYVALRAALEEAGSGDLLLYDGGFALWKERPFGGLLDHIFSEAERRGVDILAVSKSSSLSWGEGISRPFIQHTGRLGSKSLPDMPWYLDISGKRVDPDPSTDRWNGRIYVVRFHPRSGHAFRVDAPDYVAGHIDEALGRAALFSGSSESPGYPHALFRAHHEMKIREDEGSLLRLQLMDAIARSGLTEEDVRGSLDYHEILDMDLRR